MNSRASSHFGCHNGCHHLKICLKIKLISQFYMDQKYTALLNSLIFVSTVSFFIHNSKQSITHWEQCNYKMIKSSSIQCCPRTCVSKDDVFYSTTYYGRLYTLSIFKVEQRTSVSIEGRLLRSLNFLSTGIWASRDILT